MNIDELAHAIWLRVGAPEEVDESAIKALLGEQREAQGADLTNLKKALIKQLSRDAYSHLGDQAELRKAAEDIGIFIKLSKEGPEEN